MKRFGQHALLKPECVEKYKKLHAAVWPEVLATEADPITQEWWKHTKPCFAWHDEKVYYTDLEEIFHYD